MYVGSPKSKIMYLMYCSFNLGLKVGLSEEVIRGTIREEIKILMCLFCTKCSATLRPTSLVTGLGSPYLTFNLSLLNIGPWMPCEQAVYHIVPSELEASRVGHLFTRSDKPMHAPKPSRFSPFLYISSLPLACCLGFFT